MGTRRGLFHLHTWHSFDGLLPPWAYLAHARRARLDFLCVTDHNTLAGALTVAAANHDPRLEVVIGAEYATERADLIGLFLTEEVRSRRFHEAVGEIHAQGGIAVLPHPYRHRGDALDEELVAAVDAVEVFNARSSEVENGRALDVARRHGKPELAGADAHTLWELLRGGTLIELEGDAPLREALLSAPRTFTTRRTARTVRRYSQVVKRVRQRLGLPGAR
ncbi:MAG TPA: PHP domain-containing protein [candidate division Zixibacteria bacterium]|nr:PHP domain-containing protein [candidate division Zixibacteria bacterium]